MLDPHHHYTSAENGKIQQLDKILNKNCYLYNVKNLVIFITFVIVTSASSAQTRALQTVEYATVSMRVAYSKGSIIYDKKGLSKSPVLNMPDGLMAFLYDTTSDPDNPEELPNLGMVLSYMAKFGWILKSSNVLHYQGLGKADQAVSSVDEQYTQILIFERPVELGDVQVATKGN